LGNRDILAIGASAGGVEALMTLARGFQKDLPASVLMTLHLSSEFRSSLDELLNMAGPLPAHFATHGESLHKGQIYIAPPNSHLLVDGDRAHLGRGPRENNSRPAIDPMLRSAAACCGSRVIGVVLTGTLGDGASGLWAVGQCGGLTVVQDPDDAAFADMPRAALEKIDPDHVAPLKDMPKLLDGLVRQAAGAAVDVPDRIRAEVAIARGDESMIDMDRIGRRSVLSCPDCGGVMWEMDEGELTRFRCHVGHTYTAEHINLAIDDSLRRALGAAQRALEERVALTRKLHEQAIANGRRLTAANWGAKAEEYEREMQVIRAAIQRMEWIETSRRLDEMRGRRAEEES
jgi:two-component system chemotaxis response regulator CheB